MRVSRLEKAGKAIPGRSVTEDRGSMSAGFWTAAKASRQLEDQKVGRPNEGEPSQRINKKARSSKGWMEGWDPM